MNGNVCAAGGLVLAGGPFVPVVDVEELRIGLERLVPSLLEVDAVALGMLDRLAQPRHVSRHGQIVFVQLRLAVLAGPGLADQAGWDAARA